MYKLEDIINFLEKEISNSIDIKLNSDLENDLRITGDDVSELIYKYSIKFNVNMETYLWYFHHNEETVGGLGAMIYKSPRKRVSHIPITPKILLESANAGYWKIKYPEHQIPKIRYDIVINYIISFVFLAFLISIIIKKYCI